MIWVAVGIFLAGLIVGFILGYLHGVETYKSWDSDQMDGWKATKRTDDSWG